VNEDDILADLARHFPDSHASLLLGRGDDAAVVASDTPLCVSSDLFLEDVHFRRDYFHPAEIGHKALAVNISDMAACGARPLGFSLCLGLPPDVGSGWLDDFFSGMAALARRHDCVLSGGDLSACARLCIAVTIWGAGANRGVPLLRGGCKPGDALFVVGQPGLARVGLRVLETSGRGAATLWPDSCAAHLKPLPLVEEAVRIACLPGVVRPPSLMDVSDGIARDLPRLLQGREATRSLGAALCVGENDLHEETRCFAVEQGLDPVGEYLLGGEDYALLGACAREDLAALRKAVPRLRPLGVVTDKAEITINGIPFTAAGFDHFAPGEVCG
jgi:thiamine-monophosphate kinase